VDTDVHHLAKETPLRKSIMAGAAAGAFLVGAAGAALALPGGTSAADPTPSPAAISSTTPTATPATTPSQGTATTGFSGSEHGPGLDTDDLAAAAKALGMTDAELQAELESGKTAADVAKAKNVDLQKVIDAVVASDKAEIAAAVTAGTMTQAQADERLANLEQHVTDEVNGVDNGPGGGGHGGHGHGMDTGDIAAAAKVLGMTDAELTAELQAGKSAADVAKAKNVDLQKVIDAVVASDKAEIAAAVTAGTMTQAQADARLANLTQHVTDEVNGVGNGPGGGGHGGHGPRGGFDGGGQQPAASPSTGTGTGTGA
jgi:hypothetical protein